MEKSLKKVGLIILDYKKADRVCENVNKIVSYKYNFDLEIIIADNSCDKNNANKLKKLDKYKNVRIIIFNNNLGYTKAHNLALKGYKYDYLFIVNPDIIIKDENLLNSMVDYMEQNQRVAILGPKQVNDDGSMVKTARNWPNPLTQFFRRTFFKNIPIIKNIVAKDELDFYKYDKILDVPWIQSSFNLVRFDFFRKAGGLNEKYFMFMSDPELAFQAWKSGLKVQVNPEFTVYADGIRVSSGGFIAFFKKWTMRTHLMDSLKYFFSHLFEKNPFKLD